MTTLSGNNITYTSSNLVDSIGGLIQRIVTANSTDTLPTATNIITSFTGSNIAGNIGQSFIFTIYNNSSFIITLTTNTGVSLIDGTTTDIICPQCTRMYTVIQTGVSAVMIYMIGNSTVSPETNTDIYLANGNMLLGNSSNIASSVAMSGDSTISNTGVLTLNTVPVTKGGTGVTTVTTLPTATSFAGWDANSNFSANNFIGGLTTTATSAGTTTLTVSSDYNQYFTGTTTHTVVMPVTSTLALGTKWKITNNSTGVVVINSSGGNNITSLTPETSVVVFCALTSGTTDASWSWFVSSKNGPAQKIKTVITSGTTYTTPSNITTSTVFLITLVGGGGGGAAGANAGGTTRRGGGGGGATGIVSISGLSPNTAYTIAVGSGGTSAVSGGITTFQVGTVTYRAGGGVVGTAGTTTGGIGGTTSVIGVGTFLYSINGQDGFNGITSGSSGAGGSSHFGAGGKPPTVAASSGGSATGFGGGGSGGTGGTSIGGSGTQGIIIVEYNAYV